MNKYFYRLFYKERISRLAGRILSEFRCPDIGKTLSLNDVGTILDEIVKEAEDDSLCHDICKGMYFCNRKKRHKGNHSENEALFW
jgi:hypothetical protein